MPDEKSKLPPRQLCQAHLVDAAHALTAALAIAPTLEEVELARIHSATHDAPSIVMTCLNQFQHADDMRQREHATARESAPIQPGDLKGVHFC